MIRTQISMTEAQAEGLRRLAALRHRSQASLLRDALDQLLASEAIAGQIARARAAVGQHGSGDPDGAEHHDAALADAFSA